MRNTIGSGAMLLVLLCSAAQAQIRGTITSPTNVQIQAGGSAVRLTVEGYQLTSVTSIRFLQAGRLVGGISGALQTAQMMAGGTSRLALDVRADRSVPMGTYQMQLVAGTQGATLPTPIVVLSGLPQPIDQTSTALPTQQPKVGGTIAVPMPSITSATPTTLQIQAGGPAQTVVLNGSLLNQVVGAYPRLNGSRVYTGIGTQLVPSTDGARREIRVSASGTTGPWGVPLELVLEYTMGSTPIRAADPMVTPVRITAAAPPKVDLVVSSCSIDKYPNAFIARATIRNTGSEAISFQANQTMARATFGYNMDARAPGGGTYIPGGGTADVSAQFSNLPAPGTYNMSWTVDPVDLVLESNPGNNQKNCSFTVEAAPPPPPPPTSDLALSAVTVQPYSGPPGTPFVFTVTVKNIGRLSIGSAYEGVEVECKLDNARFEGGSWVWFGRIAPGESYRPKEIRTSATFAPGNKVLECTVDPYKKFNESTRNNNAKSLVFVVTK